MREQKKKRQYYNFLNNKYHNFLGSLVADTCSEIKF